MVGFKASGKVTEDDFKSTVMPAVKESVQRNGELIYLLQLETDLSEFTAGAWVQDAILGAKHLIKWNRAAIVSDKKSVRTFTDLFSKIAPGEFRGFEPSEMDAAVAWVSGLNQANDPIHS